MDIIDTTMSQSIFNLQKENTQIQSKSMQTMLPEYNLNW